MLSNTFKATGQRDGDSAITGSLTLTHITASGDISASKHIGGHSLSISDMGRLEFDGSGSNTYLTANGGSTSLKSVLLKQQV